VTPLQVAIAHGVKVGILLALIGLLARGHHRRCWAFVVYLLAITTGNCLVTFWPDLFLTEPFWVGKQALYDVLKLAVALELAYRAFRAFPGARQIARRAVFGLLLLSTAVIMAGPAHAPYRVVFDWQPRIVVGTIWIFTATALLVLWYHLPLHAWHRAILLGFTPYLVVFTTLMSVIRQHGWEIRGQISMADTLAYLGLVVWWAYAAWRPVAAPAIEEAAVSRLRLA